MAKVRKLRKKYRALCLKNTAISKSCSLKKKLNVSVLPSKENDNREDSIRKGEPVSKRKNESFRSTREAARAATATNKNDQKFQRGPNRDLLTSSDKLPVLKKRTGRKTFNKKTKNHPSKHGSNSKIRQNNLFQEINAFKKTLKEESFLKNPHASVMNQTLERLSIECSSGPEKKIKNALM